MLKTVIYGLSRGEYSDYDIFAFFSTKEKAERALADLKEMGDMNINEGVLEYVLDEIKPFDGLTPFLVMLDWSDGNGCAEKIESFYDFRKMNSEEKLETKNWHPDYIETWMRSGIVFRTYCMARNEKHALKIASERMAKKKALNL